MSDTFETPSLDDVLQEDEKPLPNVPVSVSGVVRVDEMPGNLTVCRNILLRAGVRAEKILAYNPRRKTILAWPHSSLGAEITVACIAPSESEANSFSGALLTSGANAIMRFPFDFADELWARGGVVSATAGIFNAINASTQDIVLSIMASDWSR